MDRVPLRPTREHLATRYILVQRIEHLLTALFLGVYHYPEGLYWLKLDHGLGRKEILPVFSPDCPPYEYTVDPTGALLLNAPIARLMSIHGVHSEKKDGHLSAGKKKGIKPGQKAAKVDGFGQLAALPFTLYQDCATCMLASTIVKEYV